MAEPTLGTPAAAQLDDGGSARGGRRVDSGGAAGLRIGTTRTRVRTTRARVRESKLKRRGSQKLTVSDELRILTNPYRKR